MFKYITLGISCLIVGHSYCADVHFSPAQEAAFSKLKKQQYELFRNTYEGEERDELIVNEKYIDDVHAIVDQYFTRNGYDVLKKDIFTGLVDCVKLLKKSPKILLGYHIGNMGYLYKRVDTISNDKKIINFAKLAYGGYKIFLRDIMTSEQIVKYECQPWHFSEEEKGLHYIIKNSLYDLANKECGNNTDHYKVIKHEHVGTLHCILDDYCENYCSKKEVSSIYDSIVSEIEKINKKDAKMMSFVDRAYNRGVRSMQMFNFYHIQAAYAGFLFSARLFMTDEEQETCECKPKFLSSKAMQQIYSIFSGMGTFPQN